MRKASSYCSVLVLIIVNIVLAQNDEQEIRKILNDQVQAWNRGDIDGFMKGYWNSDSTVFNSGGNAQRGYKDVLAR